jgi:hypothetical protein
VGKWKHRRKKKVKYLHFAATFFAVVAVLQAFENKEA